MERLLRKFDTAKALVPAPVRRKAKKRTAYGVIYYGSTAPAMDEALAQLEAQGLHLDAMRVRAFPFAGEVFDFIAEHELVFVVEQNRDAQLRTLLINEGGVDPARLTKVLHYEGAPITARFITGELKAKMASTGASAQGHMAK
jgi:2-oxoglutarate ferredoxin oxidoreductase subunit alpha